MDEIDKRILISLQEDVSIPLSELSKKVGISSTPCWSRIRKLEKDGVIISKTIQIDQEKINLPITVFLSISIQNNTEAWLKFFKSQKDFYIHSFKVTNENKHKFLKTSLDYPEDYTFIKRIFDELHKFEYIFSNLFSSDIQLYLLLI